MNKVIFGKILFILACSGTFAGEYICFFNKKSEVMADFFPEEQTNFLASSSKKLVKIIGNPVSISISDDNLIYKVKVYGKENIMKFRIIDVAKKSIIGWNEKQQLSTNFSLKELTMVFTELLTSDHIAAYFYSCREYQQ